jgi:hypothetical protein
VSTPTPGRVEVDPPPIEPYTYGLLSVAQVVTEDGRWQLGGVEYPSDACAQGGRVDGACPVPNPPADRTATLTATPGAGVGVRIARPEPAATTGVVFHADPNLPGPVVLTVTPPTGAPATVPVDPGASLTYDTAAAGDWVFSFPAASGCQDVTVTVPYVAGTDDFADCTSLAFPVAWSSNAGGQVPVTYTVRPQGQATVVDSGTLAPGASGPAPGTYHAAGEYDLTFTAAGADPQTGTLTLPAAGATPYALTFAVDQGTSHSKPLAEGLTWVEGGGPFTVYARAECSAVGFPDAQATALARLRNVEPREVEKAFSLLLAGETPRLPLGSTAVPLQVALGALEADAALHYAGQPTLHAPRWTQPAFTAARLVASAGPVMRTELESRIAFGGGYYDDPAAPADPAPAAGEFWLYATGTVRAFRSQPFAHEAFDPPTNTRVAIAERTYALDHDCYLAAVLVTVSAGGGA